jgi:hypothetical protein
MFSIPNEVAFASWICEWRQVVQMTRKHVAIEGNRSDERANNFR